MAHDQYTLGVRCSRSTIDGGSRSFLVCALSTLAKNSWKWIQLQQEHTNSKSWWQRPPMLAAKSPASCAVAKPSAEACDFLATLNRSASTIDGELQVFSLLPFFQTTTDIRNRSSMNTQTRIWRQRPHTYAANLGAACPSQEKSLAHCKSEIWKELGARKTQFADPSLSPMFQQQALLKKSC